MATATSIPIINSLVLSNTNMPSAALSPSAGQRRALANPGSHGGKIVVRVLVSGRAGTPLCTFTGIEVSYDGGSTWTTFEALSSNINLTADGDNVRFLTGAMYLYSEKHQLRLATLTGTNLSLDATNKATVKAEFITAD